MESVVKGSNNAPIATKKFSGHALWSGYPDFTLYYPLTMRFTFIIVAQGDTLEPPSWWNESAVTSVVLPDRNEARHDLSIRKSGEMLIVHMPSAQGATKVRLISPAGKTVLTGSAAGRNGHRLRIATIPFGVYYVVVGARNTAYRRIVHR